MMLHRDGQRRIDVVNSKRHRYKETTMHTQRFKRMAPAKSFMAGWMVLFGLAAGHTQPAGLPVPPPAAPVFNPSSPNTVPQTPEVPVSPGTPSALPASPDALLPSGEGASRTNIPSHRRVVTSTTATPAAGKAHRGRHTAAHHHHSGSRGSASSYRLPFDYDGPYCTWRPDWNGYWRPDCYRYGV